MVLFISSSLAVFALVVLESRSHHPHSKGAGLTEPQMKLLGVKLVVTVLFLQPRILAALLGRISDPELWNAWLLCLEAPLLLLFHQRYAYPSSDFQAGGSLSGTSLEVQSWAAYGTMGSSGSSAGGGAIGGASREISTASITW